MGATNSFSGKFNEGLFANGQGPIHGIQVKSEGEDKGQIEVSGPQRHPHEVGGQGGDGLDSRSEEKGFDIHSASYKGPQNWTPKNMGTTPNYDVNK